MISKSKQAAGERSTGQSLIEVLIAVAIGVVMIGAVATLLVSALRLGTQAERVQAGVALGRELLDNVRVWSERSWQNIATLATTSANRYYLNASSSPFTLASGEENIVVATTTYTRYFYVDTVGRDAAGKILGSGGTDDPSSKKLTVVYRWPQSATNTLVTHLTRWQNNAFIQTDWSVGSGQNGPATTTGSGFSTSSKIDFATTTGSIIINFFGP